MADISMCAGKGCKVKKTCYRHTAPVNPYWQTVCHFHENMVDGKCDHYWPNDGYQLDKKFTKKAKKKKVGKK